MRGNVTRRGRNSWRLKFDLQSTDGKRQTRYVTLRGCSRKDAERELNRLIGTAHAGTYVEANETTITHICAIGWTMRTVSLPRHFGDTAI